MSVEKKTYMVRVLVQVAENDYGMPLALRDRRETITGDLPAASELLNQLAEGATGDIMKELHARHDQAALAAGWTPSE